MVRPHQSGAFAIQLRHGLTCLPAPAKWYLSVALWPASPGTKDTVATAACIMTAARGCGTRKGVRPDATVDRGCWRVGLDARVLDPWELALKAHCACSPLFATLSPESPFPVSFAPFVPIILLAIGSGHAINRFYGSEYLLMLGGCNPKSIRRRALLQPAGRLDSWMVRGQPISRHPKFGGWFS